MMSRNTAVRIAAAFVLTVAAARLVSLLVPRFHWEPIPGMHIHHYVYGIFILTAAGYFALIFKGARATMWIALLYGLGVGLTFDEFGFWIDPPFVRGVRWNTNGLLIVIVMLAAAGLLVPVLVQRAKAPGQSEVVSPTPGKPFPDPSI